MSTTEQLPIGTSARLSGLDAVNSDSGLLNVVIECPLASRVKYKYDEKQGLFLLHKLLPLGATFPYDFGFIPSTRGEDGDPLDVLVLLNEPLAVGCVVPVRLIGVLEAEQTQDGRTIRNDRLIGVVETKVNPAELTSIRQVGEQTLREIEHFFVSYNEMEGRQFRCLGRRDADRALELVEKSRRRVGRAETYQKRNGKDSSAAPAEPCQSRTGQSQIGHSQMGVWADIFTQTAAPGRTAGKPSHERQQLGGSYTLKKGAPFRKDVRRIVRRQLDKALRDLCRLGATADEAIHNVRKRFKRVRAILRMVQSELGDRAFRKENEALRDAAAAFSDVRNARVLVDAVGKLKKRGGDVPPAAFESLERFLKTKQRDTHERLARNVDAMDDLREAIEKGRKQTAVWSLPRDGRPTIRRGLRCTCRAGCDALGQAEKQATSEHLHEFRKQAKYLYHQVQILERVDSEALDELVEQLHQLEKKLGDDHDLGMLRGEVSACIAGGLPDVDERLIVLIDGWRKELQSECLQNARKVYRDDSALLRHRFRDWSKQFSPKKSH
jgi:inorganic pyrophosphatase